MRTSTALLIAALAICLVHTVHGARRLKQATTLPVCGQEPPTFDPVTDAGVYGGEGPVVPGIVDPVDGPLPAWSFEVMHKSAVDAVYILIPDALDSTVFGTVTPGPQGRIKDIFNIGNYDAAATATAQAQLMATNPIAWPWTKQVYTNGGGALDFRKEDFNAQVPPFAMPIPNSPGYPTPMPGEHYQCPAGQPRNTTVTYVCGTSVFSVADGHYVYPVNMVETSPCQFSLEVGLEEACTCGSPLCTASALCPSPPPPSPPPPSPPPPSPPPPSSPPPPVVAASPPPPVVVDPVVAASPPPPAAVVPTTTTACTLSAPFTNRRYTSNNNAVQRISSTTNVATLAACQALCSANQACRTYVYRTAATRTCELFNVATTALTQSRQGNGYTSGSQTCTTTPVVTPVVASPPPPAVVTPVVVASPPPPVVATVVTPTCTVSTIANRRYTSNNNAVQRISSTTVATLAACQANCNANAACLTYVYRNRICEMFNVAATALTQSRQGNGYTSGVKTCV